MDPCPWPAPMHIADATGYPLTHTHVLRWAPPVVCSMISVRAPRVPLRGHLKSKRVYTLLSTRGRR
jgi:hypothetical protein